MKPLPQAGQNGSKTTRFSARATVLTGGLIASIFFGFGGFWAVNASIDSAVIAPGELIVEGNRTRVQHLEGGIVAGIEVEDGARVSVGDPLLRLEDVRARAQLVALEAEYFEALGRAARLRAERGQLPEIPFPDILLSASDREQVAEVIEMQSQLFKSRRQTSLGQKEILASRIPQYNSMITGLDAQISALQRQLEIFKEELSIVEELFEKGMERRPRVLQLRRNVAGTEGEIGDLIEKRGQTLLAISELEMRLIDFEDSRMSAIDEELTPLLSRLIDLQDRLLAAQDQLERTVIRAPVDGIVVGLNVHNTGAVIQAGDVLLSIVPESARLIVHARVTPLDVDLVAHGLSGQVVLSSFRQSEVPPLDARVKRVSADRLEDDRSGETYFETVLEFTDTAAVELVTQQFQLIPGMPAEVFINTGERSPLDYLLQPLRESFGRALREN